MITIPATYDYRLVALSVLIAIFASYAALDLAGRVTATRDQARSAWLIGGAIAMGTGIWSMHYTGMLAFRLPMRVYYHVPTVLLSLLAAHHHYDPGLWLLSVLVAVVIALAALWLTFHFRDENRGRIFKTAVAVVMGLAIPLMHYTGMAAVSYMPTDTAPDLSNAIDISALANSAVILVTLVIVGSALLSSLVDRRFSAQARELELSEQRYQHLFDSNPHPTFVFELETLRFLPTNRAAIDKYGFSWNEFLAMKFTHLHPAEELGRLLETAQSGVPMEEQYRRNT